MPEVDYAPETTPCVVLVVEDEPLIRLMVCDVLRDAGFTVVEASSAEEALGFLQAGREVRMVFSDVNLPGAMSGLDLARRLRAEYPVVDVVLTSGHLEGQDIDPEIGFFRKPYVLDTLVAALRERIGGPAGSDPS